jgi:hypothetical protein
MVCATWIIAIASIITALAGIASALYVRWGIKEQTASFEKQSTTYRLSLSLDLALRLDDRFNRPEFKEARSRAAAALLARQNESEAEEVFDFFDSIGLVVRLGAFREEIAHSFFFHWINLYWNAGKHFIGTKQKETSEVWKDFESLYHKVRAIEKQKNPDSEDLKLLPDRLNDQLQEEME